MRVAIFGASGMLGSILTKLAFLEGKHEVFPYSRKEIPIVGSKIKHRNFDAQNYDVSEDNFDVVVNCCGVIKQKQSNKDDLYAVNATFPQRLAEKYGEKLIHVSTDCVFSGKRGQYVETDEKDCEDDYGMSKSKGEDPRCRVFRTSIIGTHPHDSSGLLEWFRSCSGKSVKGYVDHYWGGVTTLRLSQCILERLDAGGAGVTHIYSDRVSKFELLKSAREIFEVEASIQEYSAGFIDRSLSSILQGNFTNGEILQQLKELKDFERVRI